MLPHLMSIRRFMLAPIVSLFLVTAFAPQASANYSTGQDPCEGAHGAPEIDSNLAGSALVLLLGGVLLLTTERRKRSDA